MIRKGLHLLRYYIDCVRFFSFDGYNEDKYWKDRFSTYGFDLRGVGNGGLTTNENIRMYAEAKKIFISLCKREGVSFRGAKVLEVGCGAGFYTSVAKELGAKDYTGLDISDVLFKGLRERFLGFRFIKSSISQFPLQEKYDVIIMIDVTQHITTPEKFSFAMRNIGDHLNPGGTFIVTSWLVKSRKKRGYYEVARSMEDYRGEFSRFSISEPMRFRDKFIFSVRKGKK